MSSLKSFVTMNNMRKYLLNILKKKTKQYDSINKVVEKSVMFTSKVTK